MEILPVMGHTANDWEISAQVFNTALLRQDAARWRLDEESQKYKIHLFLWVKPISWNNCAFFSAHWSTGKKMSTVDHKKMCNYCTCARPQKDFACIFESEEESHFRVRGTCMARDILNHYFIVLWKHAMYLLFWMCSQTASFSLPGTKSILETSSLLWNLLVFLCGKLKMRGQYHVDKRQDIYHNLQVAENSGEERSYLKSRFHLHLYVDKSQEM